MKHFENRWIFEPFEEHSDCIVKSMFGGLAMYYQGQLKLVLMENPGDTSYRGQKFPFDIWNGLMIATDKECHQKLTQLLSSLTPHPVLPKWLYLPFASEHWENDVETLQKLIRRGDPLIGVWPQKKKTKKRSSS